MSNGSFARLVGLFEDALKLDPPDRETFVASACAGDSDLASALVSLIRLDGNPAVAVRTGSMLRPALSAFAGPGRVPERIGPYRLIERVGEGGMGIVYRADQEQPVRRTVAIKVLTIAHAGREAVSRFEFERRALSRLNHPHIAKLFDAGTTEDGLDYLALEFVEGESITLYADRRRLPLADRLHLFAEVCEAVQHAHRNAVIHRDIKPSNILVCEIDGRPVPKIIDFGVAKTMADEFDRRPCVTAAGTVLGTPEYMSPEQASLGAVVVDTRTDVYSLGVLLYELITGVRPFRAGSGASGVLNLLRRIREEQPVKPSAVCPHEIKQRLLGDLDWIIGKSMEKQPARRYATPADLAEDVRRYLHGEPVMAEGCRARSIEPAA